MNAKTSTIALKLLNLYRQEHVIVGGWTTVNPIFVNEATDDVIKELRDMPTGKLLVRHIENLRSGKTPMDSIDPELLPYGGMMIAEDIATIKLTANQWQELEDALNSFTPDQMGLERFMKLDVVREFGEEWQNAIRSALNARPQLLDRWNIVNQTYNAYRLWDTANEIIANPISERSRAQVQADMPEYETYLPMFGDAGTELLAKLRTFVSSLN
ncbi:MAG: hypothetical protein KIG73_00525 [Alphaproteobacteria bacterium]|nr:hypothetical protein [Alphaproteobacteria bacterium]